MFFRGEFGGPERISALKMRGGIFCGNASITVTAPRIADHIGGDTRESPFVSLSRSRKVAERYAGYRGLVLGVEVEEDALIDPRFELENWKAQQATLSHEELLRFREALEMAAADEEYLIVRFIPLEWIKEIKWRKHHVDE